MNRITTLILFSIFCIVTARTAPAGDAWIFSGQSNMRATGSAVKQALSDVVKKQGGECVPVYVAEPGKPVEGWLDPEHRDYAKLWQRLEAEVKEAARNGHRFRGFVWYQGESNVSANAGKYQEQLAELVLRVRKLTGEPQLPVIVVQIGAATSYEGRGWAVGVIREAQRRFAESDQHAALVTAIDAEIGDYTVHMSKNGAETVASRVAAAARRLVYNHKDSFWGPQIESVRFAGKDRRHVLVTFREVQGRLQLHEGWLAGFGASLHTRLPEPLSKLEDAVQPGQAADDFIYPRGGAAAGGRQLVLFFEKPLAAGARLSYAAQRNAQYGPHRLWRLEFGGLQDSGGNQAAAFTLVEIQPRAADISLPQIEPAEPLHSDWRQLAINCIGRFPAAVTGPKATAGIAEDGWRQAFWNPVSSGTTAHLFDQQGRVTGAGFVTGVWYMSPYFTELKTADDALMASWCKNRLHQFTGLKPGGVYNLAIYLLQGPAKKGPSPAYRDVRVRVVEIPTKKQRRENPVQIERLVRVPASGQFQQYQIAAAADQATGNVLLVKGARADGQGRLSLEVQVQEQRGERLRWVDTTLAGVQIRVAGNASK